MIQNIRHESERHRDREWDPKWIFVIEREICECKVRIWTRLSQRIFSVVQLDKSYLIPLYIGKGRDLWIYFQAPNRFHCSFLKLGMAKPPIMLSCTWHKCYYDLSKRRKLHSYIPQYKDHFWVLSNALNTHLHFTPNDHSLLITWTIQFHRIKPYIYIYIYG